MPDLNMDLLNSLGITIIGDILTMVRHAKLKSEIKVEETTPAKSPFKAAAAVAKLPAIPLKCTHPQFRKLLVDWDLYKKVIGLPVEHIATHLYSSTSKRRNCSLATKRFEPLVSR